jgi:transposase-like protein
LEGVYAAVFIDAIMVKGRDGQVGNRPIYAALGVDLEGHKDILTDRCAASSARPMTSPPGCASTTRTRMICIW